MDSPHFKTLRIAPTTQQGGTQTIQQSIYLTHNNPCGANLLVFQEMGKTQIRYIDLKNFLDAIVGSEEMRLLFEEIRVAATEYIASPDDSQKFYKYLYSIMNWGKHGIGNLPVPADSYPGYRFRVEVFDAAGIEIYDSYYPTLEIMLFNSITGIYSLFGIPLVPSQIRPDSPETGPLYKLTSIPRNIPFIDSINSSIGFSVYLSNFLYNQSSMTETVMAVASLLIDSANTRTFGIPKYGFSARQNLSPFGGITYNCVNFIDIRTIPDENGNTTLVESIFFRISLNEDTYNFSSPSPPSLLLLNKNFEEEEIMFYMKSLMENEEIMHQVVRLINTDLKNLESNLELIRNGQEDKVFLKYYRKLIGIDEEKDKIPSTEDNLEQQPEEPSTEDNLEQQPEEPSTEDNLEQQPEEPSTEDNLEQQPEEPSTEDNSEQQPEEPITEDNLEQQPEEPSTEDNLEQQPEEPSTEDNLEQQPEEPSIEDNLEQQPEEPSTEDNLEQQPEEPSTEDNLEQQPEEQPE